MGFGVVRQAQEIGRTSIGDAFTRMRHATVHMVPAIYVDAIAESGRLILDPRRNLSSPTTPSPYTIVCSLSRRRHCFHYVHTRARRRPVRHLCLNAASTSAEPVMAPGPDRWMLEEDMRSHLGYVMCKGLTTRWAHGPVKVGPISDSEENLSPSRADDHPTRH